MTFLLATTAPAGNGAALGDIALVGGIISAATIAVLAVVVAYRRGGARPLRIAATVAERYLRVPGWAAIPAIGAIAAAVLTFMGAIWDIGVHIDEGRDTGPFGTTAHYPLLAGLVLVYLMGVLAVGMAPARERSRAAITIPGLGAIPVGALLILAGGGYAMIGFPLDDLWHRVFGQDVTLWGPTHTMFFGGLMAAATGAVILMAQGARSLGREPFGGRAWWRRPLGGVLGGIFLFVATHATDEFNWAVPQYRQIWQPLMLALFGAFALILARALGGRGATLGALAAYLPLQLIEVVMIGALHTTRPASVLFVAEALVVEIAMWRAARGRGMGIGAGALAGLGVGTVGFGAEYAWSQVAMPLPWHTSLLAEAIPVAALAGVAGGVLAILLAQAVTCGLAPGRRPLVLALSTATLVIALAVNASVTAAPKNPTATLALSNVRSGITDGGGRTQVADLRVRLSRPGLGRDGNWAYVLGWQGGGRYAADLVRTGDGTLRSSKPVPVGGDWKTFVRIHKGRTQIAVPIRMPADPALGFAGFPARPQVTRVMVRDTKLLQIERKDDGPLWAWTPALLFVMSLNLGLMALVGAAAVRAGRATQNPGSHDPAAPGHALDAPPAQHRRARATMSTAV